MRDDIELPLDSGTLQKVRGKKQEKKKKKKKVKAWDKSRTKRGNLCYESECDPQAAHKRSLNRQEVTAGPEGCLLPNAKMRTEPSLHLSLSWVEKPPPSNHSIIRFLKQTNPLPLKSFSFSASLLETGILTSVA